MTKSEEIVVIRLTGTVYSCCPLTSPDEQGIEGQFRYGMIHSFRYGSQSCFISRRDSSMRRNHSRANVPCQIKNAKELRASCSPASCCLNDSTGQGTLGDFKMREIFGQDFKPFQNEGNPGTGPDIHSDRGVEYDLVRTFLSSRSPHCQLTPTSLTCWRLLEGGGSGYAGSEWLRLVGECSARGEVRWQLPRRSPAHWGSGERSRC